MNNSLININKWLYPASWIYGAGVWLRNKMFDWGIYKEQEFQLPVICIGNITVGGTGKTPHTEYLIRLLQKQFQGRWTVRYFCKERQSHQNQIHRSV